MDSEKSATTTFLEFSSGDGQGAVYGLPTASAPHELDADQQELLTSVWDGERDYSSHGPPRFALPTPLALGRVVIQLTNLGPKAAKPSGKFNDEKPALVKRWQKGAVLMANSGKNSNTSQFFIVLNEDPARYAKIEGKHVLIGQIVEGMEVVDKLDAKGSASGKPVEPVWISDCGFGLISTSALPAGTTVLQVPPLASLRLDPTDSSSTNAQAILASAIVHSLKDHTPLLHFCTGDPATDACRPPPSFALPQPTSSSPITLSRQQIAAREMADHWPVATWSLINHSCIANCFWFVHPKLHYLVVRTSRPVALGSELTLAYRNPAIPDVSGRQRSNRSTDAQVDVKVRDTRECEMAVWNEAANRGFAARQLRVVTWMLCVRGSRHSA
ncbi:hypothetical protein BCR44DRAFT_1512749 [Catenaria anguillulae PL171]|uniref:peptidylprolyl isomerase n=1 Tax=Catenaria anguillulae PL171 TaxID=765915 RepID=A0A1Y2HT01_9FUNG|nr:hypothetical protein BCR44DRAFT_1512749 [Catenaria anguillulae PL171]